MFRLALRSALKFLVSNTIKKHKPHVIVVIGTGKTSIAREVVYAVLSAQFPTRRNIETPEAEFSIPLTILGYKKYPKSYFDWILLIFKTLLQLVVVKPYEHYLVLEVNMVRKDAIEFWLSVIKPEVLVAAGNIPDGYLPSEGTKIYEADESDDDILIPYVQVSQKIGEHFGISESEISRAIENLSLPNSKVRFLPGANESLIIDATHYYFPQPLESVFELVEDSTNGKVIFTQNKNEIKISSDNGWQVNPENYKPKQDDAIILRGERVKVLYKFGYLIK
jgi:hypothetical protein